MPVNYWIIYKLLGVVCCCVKLGNGGTIIPPKEAIIMDEFGQRLRGMIGPYNEGFPLALACEGEGGDPSPSVHWWRDGELLDDSYYITPQGFARNELILARLHRKDLLTQLTCQVTNSNLTAPVTSSVQVDMNLKPTDVQITSLFRPMSANHPSEVVCVARGARPPAQISWWLDGEKLTSHITESSVKEENLTVSSLVYHPVRHDNQRNLSCRGDNPQLPDSVLEDAWVLDVHFPPELTVKISKQPPIAEGSDVTFTCIGRANPPIQSLEWLKDGVFLGPPTHLDKQDGPLKIWSLTADHRGKYQCAAVNSEGRTLSQPLPLKVHFTPRCRSVRGRVYGVGHTESVSVACEVDANPSAVSFSWTLQGGVALLPEQYHTNGTQSVATLFPKSAQDYGLLKCWATNNIGRQKDPCTFRIVPASPPDEPKNCVIANRTHQCIQVECEGGHDGGLQQLFRLEVLSTDSDQFVANVSAHNAPHFSICSLPPQESFVFVLYAINSKGRSKEVALHTSTLSYSGGGGDADDVGAIRALIAVIGGVGGVFLVMLTFILCLLRYYTLQGASESENNERNKDEPNLTKDCKEPCVASSLGPDIIPDKSYFQDRQESMPQVIEVEQGINPSLAQTDPMCRKYTEYKGVSYPDDPKLIASPRKHHLSEDCEVELLETRSKTETPLISSISPILKEWPNLKKETVHFSTPV